jgi:hypothetical protein
MAALDETGYVRWCSCWDVDLDLDLDLGMRSRDGGRPYWNPMWEWATIREHRMASMTGLREPAAKGAMVRGTRPTQTALLSVSFGFSGLLVSGLSEGVT